MWKDIKAVVKGLIHVQHFYDAERRITSEIIWLRNEMNSLINQMVFRGEAQQQLTSKIDNLERRMLGLETSKILWLKVTGEYDSKADPIEIEEPWLAVIVYKGKIFDYGNGTDLYSFDGKTLRSCAFHIYELSEGSISRLSEALKSH